jgi:hypothetical protein
MLLITAGEDGVFEGPGAVEAPLVLGDGLGEVEFEGADGCEGSADGFAVFLEGGLIFRGVDDDLAGEAVAKGSRKSVFCLRRYAGRWKVARWRGWR